jgi:hypothetical protein
LDVTVAAIAVGLCGDILEVYTGAMYNIGVKLRDKLKGLLPKKKVAVQTPNGNANDD